MANFGARRMITVTVQCLDEFPSTVEALLVGTGRKIMSFKIHKYLNIRKVETPHIMSEVLDQGLSYIEIVLACHFSLDLEVKLNAQLTCFCLARSGIRKH